MRWWVLVLVFAGACERQFNPEFCFGHPDDVRCVADAAPPCVTNADCPGQVCDTVASPSKCADCSAADVSLCSLATPACGTDDRCRACLTDADCAAGVCLPDGTCPVEGQIIYASQAGSGVAGCGAPAMPCTIVQAIAEVKVDRSIIKLAPSATQDYSVGTNSGLNITANATIDARGATIKKTGNGPVITIGAGKTVTLLGGAVTGGLGGSGDGITCTSGVLTVIDTDIGGNAANGIGDTGCGLVIEHATIHNNVLVGIAKSTGSLSLVRSTIKVNTSGGVVVSTNGTRFTIVGNVFWTNGSGGSNVGGLFLQTDTSTTSRLEFNTFNGNLDNFTGGFGINCQVNGFVGRNNVVFQNGLNEQVTGTCTHEFTLSSPGTALVGMGNKMVDPMFVSATGGDLHTNPGSPVEGAADPSADLTGIAAQDIDGHPRPSPADIGAYQH